MDAYRNENESIGNDAMKRVAEVRDDIHRLYALTVGLFVATIVIPILFAIGFTREVRTTLIQLDKTTSAEIARVHDALERPDPHGQAGDHAISLGWTTWKYVYAERGVGGCTTAANRPKCDSTLEGVISTICAAKESSDSGSVTAVCKAKKYEGGLFISYDWVPIGEEKPLD